MIVQKPYCNPNDIRDRLPLFIDEVRQRNDFFSDDSLLSFCNDISIMMDAYFLQNGIVVPINYIGDSTTENFEFLVSYLKNVAITGVSGMVLRAVTGEPREQTEKNIHEYNFDRSLLMVIRMGFPLEVKETIKLEEALSPSVGGLSEPWVNKTGGFNYDS